MTLWLTSILVEIAFNAHAINDHAYLSLYFHCDGSEQSLTDCPIAKISTCSSVVSVNCTGMIHCIY